MVAAFGASVPDTSGFVDDFAEIFSGICQFLPVFWPVVQNFYFLSLFNSKTTGPIFTAFLHDVEELVQLLMRAFTKRYHILFQNARSKSEVGQFRRLPKNPQN